MQSVQEERYSKGTRLAKDHVLAVEMVRARRRDEELSLPAGRRGQSVFRECRK